MLFFLVVCVECCRRVHEWGYHDVCDAYTFWVKLSNSSHEIRKTSIHLGPIRCDLKTELKWFLFERRTFFSRVQLLERFYFLYCICFFCSFWEKESERGREKGHQQYASFVTLANSLAFDGSVYGVKTSMASNSIPEPLSLNDYRNAISFLYSPID